MLEGNDDFNALLESAEKLINASVNRSDEMKRSHINAVLKKMEGMINEYKFALPPFLSWTPEEWPDKGHEYDEIRDNMLRLGCHRLRSGEG